MTDVRLRARDLAALAAFYGDVFGLPIEHVDGEWLRVTSGASTLTFVHDERVTGGYHFAFNVPENQAAPAKAWLAARCELVTDPSGLDEFHFENWDAHAVYAYDPAGNIIELIARHTLENASRQPFGPHSLLSISEIGVVSNNVVVTAERATDVLNAAPYKTALNEMFVPVGDEHGLLICVAEGRRWYPDGKLPAPALPAEITVAELSHTAQIHLTDAVLLVSA